MDGTTRRALVVDDERTIVDVLARYLRDEGFEVTVAYDGAAGLAAARAATFDVVLLDLTLPLLSGIEVFREIRRTSDVPVLMVTSRDDAIDRIVGLELGADDYIAKPFNPREVVARVRNVVRRARRDAGNARPAHDVQTIGALAIDRTAHDVRVDGKAVRLTPTEYRILDVLAANVGAALTRAQLLDKIRVEETDVYDRTLDKHVANLRRKIGDDPQRPRYLTTVHGVGYKLVG